MMGVELIPVAQFSERLAAGWQMLHGYPLEPGDYAVLMAPPGWNAHRGRNHKGQFLTRSWEFGSAAEVRQP